MTLKDAERKEITVVAILLHGNKKNSPDNDPTTADMRLRSFQSLHPNYLPDGRETSHIHSHPIVIPIPAVGINKHYIDNHIS